MIYALSARGFWQYVRRDFRWLKDGGYIGWVHVDSSMNRFEYFDGDGKIVRVWQAMQLHHLVEHLDEFGHVPPDVLEMVPVFGFNWPPNHVFQQQYKFVDKSQELNTIGLATCTALMVTIGPVKCMTHLDAITLTAPIIRALKDAVHVHNTRPCNVLISVGPEDHTVSLEKAKEICTALCVTDFDISVAEDGKATY